MNVESLSRAGAPNDKTFSDLADTLIQSDMFSILQLLIKELPLST